MLLVALRRHVWCFVAILELDLGHQVDHEAPHCFLLLVAKIWLRVRALLELRWPGRLLAASRPPASMLSLGDRKPTLALEKRPGRSTSDNRGLACSFPALKFCPLGARHLARVRQLRRGPIFPLDH